MNKLEGNCVYLPVFPRCDGGSRVRNADPGHGYRCGPPLLPAHQATRARRTTAHGLHPQIRNRRPTTKREDGRRYGAHRWSPWRPASTCTRVRFAAMILPFVIYVYGGKYIITLIHKTHWMLKFICLKVINVSVNNAMVVMVDFEERHHFYRNSLKLISFVE